MSTEFPALKLIKRFKDPVKKLLLRPKNIFSFLTFKTHDWSS